jgi:hypothetical protein
MSGGEHTARKYKRTQIVNSPSLLETSVLPAPRVGKGPIRLLRCRAFHPRYGGRLPAFCKNLPADPQNAGRDWSDRDWVLSQPPGSLPNVFRYSEKCRGSRGLAGNGRVSGDENPTFLAARRIFLDESLLREISISEIIRWAGPETGCVLAETGSNFRALIPQQQLLVHGPGDVGQDTCPLHKFPLLPADPKWAPLTDQKT